MYCIKLMPVCAVVLRGESFRKGSQDTRVKGIPEAYEDQMRACASHLELFKYMESKGVTVHVYIHTISTPYNNDLLKVYGDYVKKSTFRQQMLRGQEFLVKEAADNVHVDEYDSLMLTRIDLILRPQFFTVFNPLSEKILFISVCWWKDRYTPRRNPRVNDVFYFFPKNLYQKFHEAQARFGYGHNFLDNVPCTQDEWAFFVDYFLDSDSEKDLNPLYRIANRKEATIFQSPGKKYPDDF